MKLHRHSLLVLLVLIACATRFASAAHAGGVTDADIASLLSTPAESAKLGATATDSAPGMGHLFIQMTLALGVVFGLMAVVLWAARRYLPQAAGKSARGKGIEILATRVIGQRRSLMLVRAGDKTLLLGVTPNAIQTLSELESEFAAATPASEFSQWRAAAHDAGLPQHTEDAGLSDSHGTTSLGTR